MYQLKRILKKPPHIIIQRIWQETRIRIEKYTAPHKTKSWNIRKLLSENKAASLSELWQQLGAQPFFYPHAETIEVTAIPSENLSFIKRAADNALHRKVNLLGTGAIELGTPIDWQKDYKTNKRWPQAFFKNIAYSNLNLPSDVKIPWEISRLQWLIPMGQMYTITKDEKYAIAAKTILLEWIYNNPYAYSVNWTCTMEVAIRIIVWTWLFFAFWQSNAWQDSHFQAAFLTTLYLHGDFTQHHLEKSSINGNHYIANAAGLVFAGLYFSKSKRAKGWHRLGWKILNKEIDLQISTDGVDYEGSIPYHRLVTEIFLLPALLHLRKGFSLPKKYQEYLLNMADFIAHYSRQDGSAPLIGDADDGRILPLGEQHINDHRYLIGLIALGLDNRNLGAYFNGPTGEIFWLNGNQGVQNLLSLNKKQPSNKAFKTGGYYIIRNDADHVFIDCAPVGLKGNGGHGHNDCLSFEAMLNHVLLIVDSGAYVYTASPTERNYFRSTKFHNTPIIDNVEINRFIGPLMLWNLHYDAKPTLLAFENVDGKTIFKGSHGGYSKINPSLSLTRVITLNHSQHELVIQDHIETDGRKTHEVKIPFHFHPQITLKKLAEDLFECKAQHDAIFLIKLSCSIAFSTNLETSFYSESYGKKTSNHVITSDISLKKSLIHTVTISRALRAPS